VLLFKTHEFVRTIEYIEAICNELNFDIIKIDEQKDKILKLNKISEATQSHKISTVSNLINEKIKIVTSVMQNNPNNSRLIPTSKPPNETNLDSSKNVYINNINNKSNLNNDNKNAESTSNCIFLSQSDYEDNNEHNSDMIIDDQIIITDTNGVNHSPHNNQDLINNEYNNYNTKDIKNKEYQEEIKEKISLLTDNIYKISANKKTLIMIPDNFEDLEDEKGFYYSLCNKSANTKCPIIILTGNCCVKL